MPEQVGRGAIPVASQPFEAPFETQIVRLGLKGLQLNKSVDATDPLELTRMTNVVHTESGHLITRGGQIVLVTGGSRHHSISRLNYPPNYQRIVGVDGSLYFGSTGALTLIEAGYSGEPLHLVPHQTPASETPWMFVADVDRQMRKVTAAGLALPVGLPAPATKCGAVADAPEFTTICGFDGSDGTNAAVWIGHLGGDYTTPHPRPTGVPTAIDCASPAGTGVLFQTNPDTVLTAYTSFWSRELGPVDLSRVGAKDASDDDLIHLWIWISQPHIIDELRIYLIVSSDFDQASPIPPGISAEAVPRGGGASSSSNFYVKSFRASDLTTFVQLDESATDMGDRLRQRVLLDEFREARARAIARGVPDELRDAQLDIARSTSLQVPPGGGQWQEHGIVGVPVRRGDFLRVGTDETLDWSAVYGIVVFVKTTSLDIIRIGLDDLYLTGGSGPDTSEPGATKYDYRYTHWDPRTDAEGNPSPEFDDADEVDSLRQSVTITPPAYAGDAAMRQRIYRRGGSLNDDWYFVGENAGNGAAFVDDLSDLDIVAAGTLALDHDQPITTLDASGATVLNHPVSAIWGPVEGMLFACGDTNRPGHVYYCIPNEPDHWPSASRVEVCGSSEILLTGCVWGSQAYVFSREGLYALLPNLTGMTGVTATSTLCRQGLLSRWSLAVGPGGIYFANRNGVWVTAGGEPILLSWDLQPLFDGREANGYLPIDFEETALLRCLAVYDHQVYFLYQDTAGVRQVMIYSILMKQWRHVRYRNRPECVSGEACPPTPRMLVGGANSGKTYRVDGAEHDYYGTGDDGDAIQVHVRTGSLDQGRPREDKLYGDLILDADRDGLDLIVQTSLNNEAFLNAQQLTGVVAGLSRFIFDPFGVRPQKARNIAVDLSWSSTSEQPRVNLLGISHVPQPDMTVLRVTNWDELGQGAEKYFTGLTIECDTFGNEKTVVVEYDLNGVVVTASTLSITCDGRHKRSYSWPAVKANLVRIRPTNTCTPWIVYRLDWIATPEPPRIAVWDINFENAWDAYYTGVDLECDTFNQPKTVEVYVDGVLVKTDTVTCNGRKVWHITITPGRGHVFRVIATDANPGLLYSHRWHIEQEPSEQTNWNQNYTIAGTQGPKYFKGVVVECDTFGQDKLVEVQIDHVTIATLTVNTNDRRVVYAAFPRSLGRVLRILPVDAYPGRLYTWFPIFDEEPLELDRWETEETDHGLGGFQVPLYAQITYRSGADDVALRVFNYHQNGVMLAMDLYTLPASSGITQKRFVPFVARKGVLFRYLLTSASPFALHREESHVVVRPWGGDPIVRHPFGGDDLDLIHAMQNPTMTAAAPGGGARA